jgi:hypothetical protein
MTHLNLSKSSDRPNLRGSKASAINTLIQRIKQGETFIEKGKSWIEDRDNHAIVRAWFDGNITLLTFIFDNDSVKEQYPESRYSTMSKIDDVFKALAYLQVVMSLMEILPEPTVAMTKPSPEQGKPLSNQNESLDKPSAPLSYKTASSDVATNSFTSSSKTIKILFLTANPTDSSRLRLDEESRTIDLALRQAEFRDRFEIQQHWAVRVSELQSYLLRHKPDIVHFSGHGSRLGQIILEDNLGNSQPVSERALSTLFSVLKDNIRCVLLNACYSERQARAIVQHIDCVVGMSSAIGDKSAISFAAAFYQALGYGRDVKTAFELGCVQIDLESLDEQSVPKLLAIKTNPAEIVFAA